MGLHEIGGVRNPLPTMTHVENKFCTEKGWVRVDKDDKLSHQINKKVPSFYANKRVSLSLDIWCSRKAVKYYYRIHDWY